MKNRPGPCAALSLFVLAVALLLPSSGRSQTPSEEAKDHYRKGTAAYNLGKYAEAAQEYELSYRATLDPALLFNVAQAYRLAGDRKKALTAYKSYLRSAPDADKRALAEARVREIEAALNYDDPFAVEPTTPASRAAPVPAPAPMPARHSPIMEAPSPAAPDTSTASSRPTATLASPPASATRPFYQRWPFWAGVGAVGLIVIVAVVAQRGSSLSEPETTYGTMRF